MHAGRLLVKDLIVEIVDDKTMGPGEAGEVRRPGLLDLQGDAGRALLVGDDGQLEIENVEVATRLFRSMLETNFFWPGITEVHDIPEGADRELLIDSAVRMFLAYYSAAD